MRALPVDELIKRLASSTTPVKLSIGGRKNRVLTVEPSRLVQLVSELRSKNTLAWMSYCYDCTGVVIEGSYVILRANTDYFVFPDEDINIPAEHLLKINVELIRGYRSRNGYIAVTGDSDTISSVMKIVDYLLDNDIVLLVHKPTEPCIRVA